MMYVLGVIVIIIVLPRIFRTLISLVALGILFLFLISNEKDHDERRTEEMAIGKKTHTESRR